MEGKGRHLKAKGVGWRHHLANGIQQVCAQQHNRSSATSARCARLPHLNQMRAKSPVVASQMCTTAFTSATCSRKAPSPSTSCPDSGLYLQQRSALFCQG